MIHEDELPKRPLSKRQQQIYDFIVESIESGVMPPTIREIGKKFRMSSTNAVIEHLDALELKGWITRVPLVPRGIRIVGPAAPTPRSRIRAALVRLMWNSIADGAECTCELGDPCPECQAYEALYGIRWPGPAAATERLAKETRL